MRLTAWLNSRVLRWVGLAILFNIEGEPGDPSNPLRRGDWRIGRTPYAWPQWPRCRGRV